MIALLVIPLALGLFLYICEKLADPNGMGPGGAPGG